MIILHYKKQKLSAIGAKSENQIAHQVGPLTISDLTEGQQKRRLDKVNRAAQIQVNDDLGLLEVLRSRF